MGMIKSGGVEHSLYAALRKAEERKRSIPARVRSDLDGALMRHWPGREIEDLRREHADLVVRVEARLIEYHTAVSEAAIKHLRNLCELLRERSEQGAEEQHVE